MPVDDLVPVADDLVRVEEERAQQQHPEADDEDLDRVVAARVLLVHVEARVQLAHHRRDGAAPEQQNEDHDSCG